jgi:ribosomal protein S27E
MSKKKQTKLQAAYIDGECPDCGDPIPNKAKDGESCQNCGHVFWEDVQEDE